LIVLHFEGEELVRWEVLPDVRDNFFQGGYSDYTAFQQPMFDDLMYQQIRRAEKIKHHNRHHKKAKAHAHPKHHRKSQKHRHP